jgi:hypothetical protein
MVRFLCPCGKRLKARDRYAGQSVRCPVCKLAQTVPTLGLATPLRQLPVPVQANGLCRGRGEEWGRDG